MSFKQIFSLIFFFAFFFSFVNLIHAANETELLGVSQDSYFEADAIIKDMQKKGYPTLPLLDMLSKSMEQFNQALYADSYNTSQEIKIKSDEISLLYKDIERISESLNILKNFDIDTTSLELELLYAKSDFEAANIETSKAEAETLDKKVFPIFLNLSKQKYKEMHTYRENLLINGINESYFEEYYKNETSLYNSKKYFEFLFGYRNFLDLQRIIEQKIEVEKNIIIIKAKNISFERQKGSFELFYLQINEKNYESALNTISNLLNTTKTALKLKNESKTIDSEFERIQSLGILDNKTIDTYNRAKQEFSLENFEEAEKLFLETKKSLQEIETNNIVFGGIRKAELKKNLIDFLINNWILILVVAALIAVLFKPLKKYSQLKIAGFKLSKLKSEKEAIISLQKELQKDYYIGHSIDKKSYHKEFSRIEERKIEIGNQIAMNEEKEKEHNQYFKDLKKKMDIFKRKK